MPPIHHLLESFPKLKLWILLWFQKSYIVSRFSNFFTLLAIFQYLWDTSHSKSPTYCSTNCKSANFGNAFQVSSMANVLLGTLKIGSRNLEKALKVSKTRGSSNHKPLLLPGWQGLVSFCRGQQNISKFCLCAVLTYWLIIFWKLHISWYELKAFF